MIFEAYKWLNSKDFGSWLSFILFFYEANDKNCLPKLWEPFLEVAKYNKELCNFLIMLMEKIESEFTKGKRSGSQEFLEFLKNIREEFSAYVALSCSDLSKHQPSDIF